MSRAQQPVRDLDEYIVSSQSRSAKKKHRPSEDGDEPACDAPLHDGDWTRKVARQTIFYDHCSNPQCFGGDDQ